MTSDFQKCSTPEEAIDRLIKLYDDQIALIENRFEKFANDTLDTDVEEHGMYPEIVVEVPAERSIRTSSLALGEVVRNTVHATTITQPRLFKDYLFTQLEALNKALDLTIKVGLSTTPIPLAFAFENASATLSAEKKETLQSYFHTPNLVATNDEIVDGKRIFNKAAAQPLSLFTAERTDYSLHRLKHYTATNPKHFQQFILFTNYQRYVDEFIQYSLDAIKSGKAKAFVEPGNRITGADGVPDKSALEKQPQMPAYHLTGENNSGVTLVNIGVGPSNAKTITDHLAVLRPHVWMMIGHCGALRKSQKLGDYVLANAYLRDDHVLDDVLPTNIPVPTIAEVQLALTRAVQNITGVDARVLKKQLRTGTVVTTDDRNWELLFEKSAVRLNQARAIAIDMESATLAANGYRFRVPYGTLLCASDKPLHGEIKLPGMADAFYQERVGQHLEIGLKAVEYLRDEARAGNLHSRKLRSFDEPLFR